VYRCDYRDLLDAQRSSGAGLEVLTVEVEDPSRYGVVDVAEGTVSEFTYKADDPPSSIALTEDFLYDADLLLATLDRLVDEVGEDELGDFGEHLVPTLVDQGAVHALPFEGYWLDVGLVDAYWQAHMDLLGDDPELDLDDPDRPLLGRLAYRPAGRLGPDAAVTDALISPGAVVDGRVERSVIGAGVRVAKGATVRDSILMDDVEVGAGAQVGRAIVADRARIAPDAVVVGRDDLAVIESNTTVSGTWSPQ
jgi:glucose-1-phosphate adenylyltransferase